MCVCVCVCVFVCVYECVCVCVGGSDIVMELEHNNKNLFKGDPASISSSLLPVVNFEIKTCLCK